ncbi:Transcriptional regulator [Pseudoxanthomonas taiwanensis J19]|uniref:Transcriptional regulator n=1 Tax=Pseudoxanthomonas taiwanensis J19 TaxID=935569 RepID=A0A562D4U2_9GAMM|nr:Transcriptional regulator [Pseudoxanthomonas taiwanensis J19]
MDWGSLSAFVAVAERGGFSAAAEQLHLTQPAVSKRIAQLEQDLEVRLFDRLGRQVVLTEAGRLLLPRARQMLAEADAARRALQDLGQDIGGRPCCAALPRCTRGWRWTSASWIRSRPMPRCWAATWSWR